MRVILATLLLAGCAATPYYHWTKPGIAGDQLASDWQQCRGMASSDDPAIACMKARGYSLLWADHDPSNAVPPSVVAGLQAH